MNISKFGQKFTGEAGILQLMADLGAAASQPGVIMLGGGNPSVIPEVVEVFRERMGLILDSENEFEHMIGRYGGPEGVAPFNAAVAELLRREYGWEIGPENVALTNGSQTAFFLLFNLFAGEFADGSHKKILLPLAPEYIGYEDAGISEGIFKSFKPEIEFLEERQFKYRVDFESLEVTEEIGAICVSRPTNPTGNVLTGEEIEQLSQLAKAHGIPLIVDNAYGLPFPSIIFTDERPSWEPHVIMCMSLSKLGLPGVRTGIIIANEEVIQALTGMNAIMSLAPGSVGASLAIDLMRTGEVLKMSHEVIRPHYHQKVQKAVGWLHEALDGVDYYIHKPEGAIFLWLWFRDLPIDSQTLYERLKARNVLVVPGQYFFPGLEEAWQHRYECIRMSYAMGEEMVHAGVQIIGEEVKRAYEEG